MSELKKILTKLEKFKYPLLAIVLGVFILFLPSSLDVNDTDVCSEGGEGLAHILSCTEGVGETRVILSDNGVVVVCRGADKARVRLEIIQAVSSYTGFGSDKITILKMAD